MGKTCQRFVSMRRGTGLLNQMNDNWLYKMRLVEKYKPSHPTFNRPQMKATVLKTIVLHPKKPNSGNKKCVRIRLSNGKETIAFVPGIGHTLQEHNSVLVVPKRKKCLVGVKLTCVRGAYDLAHVKTKQKK